MTRVDQILNEADSYGDTVKGVVALVHELCWDESKGAISQDVTHLHGGPQSYDASSATVTPDLALHLGTAAGVVGEAKASFGGKLAKDAILEQIKKYDGVAARWVRAKQVDKAGCVLLTHGTRKVAAAQYFQEQIDKKRLVLACDLAVVGFMRSNQRKEFMYLERNWGAIAHARKDKKLGDGVSVPMEELDARYAGIKFYDGTPPLCYLLQVVWDHVLNEMIPLENFGQGPSTSARRIGRTIPVEVNVELLANRLRDAFSLKAWNPALPESPRKAQVRLALEALRRWELATKLGADTYQVGWRKLRGGALTHFARRLAKDEEKLASRKVAPRKHRGGRAGGGQLELGLGD